MTTARKIGVTGIFALGLLYVLSEIYLTERDANS